MSTTTRTALAALFATRTCAALDEVAVVLGSRPATFAASLRQPKSRTRALLEAEGYTVDLLADELRAA